MTEHTYLIPRAHVQAALRVVPVHFGQVRLGTEIPGDDGEIYTEIVVTLPDTVGGYLFVCRIAHAITEDGGFRNKIVPLPGSAMAIPETYETAEAYCHNCRRRQRRNDTFLLYHPAAGWLQVGRSCLGELTGIRNADSYATFLVRMGEEMERLRVPPAPAPPMAAQPGFARYETDLTLEYLARVCAAIRINGRFVSQRRNESGDIPTSVRANDDDVIAAVTEEDQQRAHEIVDWVRAQTPDNDFLYTAQRAAREATFDVRYRGHVAALADAYRRATTPARQLQASPPLGVVGQRIEVAVTVRAMKLDNGRGQKSRYGPSAWHLMTTDDGARCSWSSTSTVLEEGRRYQIKGMVGEHRSDRRGDGTLSVLRRCKATALDGGTVRSVADALKVKQA